MGGEVYTGPSFRSDTALVTADEIESGEVQAPPGTEPYTVEPNDNLWTIAANGGYGNPPDMAAFYADNPQYAERNPDLIYPGEIVFVRTGGTTLAANTDASADAVEQAHDLSASTDSQDRMRTERIDSAEAALASDVQAELDAGATADEIIERLGGINADPDVVAVIRETATDHAARQLVAAKASGDPDAIAAAREQFDQAVQAEVEAKASSYATGTSREDRGEGAIAAGNAISERLEGMGLSEEAGRVGGIAEQVEDNINNEL